MKDDDQVPPTGGTDLLRERDVFVRSLFRKGAELTEQLVTENERLRSQVRELEADATRMRALLASDSAARELLQKIEHLEREKNALLSQVDEAAALSTRFVSRQAEMEDELATLASLFVATDHLHRSLAFESVTTAIKDLLVQLVGARSWACYLLDEANPTPTLTFCVGEGGEGDKGSERELGIGAAKTALGRALEETFVTGTTRVAEVHPNEAAPIPRMAVPLRLEGRVTGVIVVLDLHPHKEGTTDLDRRLLDVLSVHAAAALRASLALSRLPSPPAQSARA